MLVCGFCWASPTLKPMEQVRGGWLVVSLHLHGVRLFGGLAGVHCAVKGHGVAGRRSTTFTPRTRHKLRGALLDAPCPHTPPFLQVFSEFAGLLG